MDVYLEIGRKRVFAGALEWPGWCRAARDETGALEALVAYAARHRAALGGAGGRVAAPKSASALRVVERLEGNATTDFGAPGIPPEWDARALRPRELTRLIAILRACWAAFDAAAHGARGKTLRVGPRGGGRAVDAMEAHVFEADRSYLSPIGGSFRSDKTATAEAERARLRETFVEALEARARGVPMPAGRRSSTVWPVRYAVRRSAWHALDHAWEIEDRLEP